MVKFTSEKAALGGVKAKTDLPSSLADDPDKLEVAAEILARAKAKNPDRLADLAASAEVDSERQQRE